MSKFSLTVNTDDTLSDQSDTKDMVPHGWLWVVPGVGGSGLKKTEILQFSEV